MQRNSFPKDFSLTSSVTLNFFYWSGQKFRLKGMYPLKSEQWVRLHGFLRQKSVEFFPFSQEINEMYNIYQLLILK